MNAVILAAGRGSRLKELTSDKPKCMVELRGKPLLAWQMEAIEGAGIERIGIVRGYRGESIPTERLGVFDNPRWADTNMVSSLLAARDWLRTFPCLVSYGDTVYPASTVRSLVERGGDIAIAYNTEWRTLWEKRFSDPLSDAETFRLDREGNLAEIGKRAESLEEIEGQYMGLLKFTPRGWRAVEEYLDTLAPEQVDKLDMTGLLGALCRKGVAIGTVSVAGKWLEVDSRDDLALYERDPSLAEWLPVRR